MISFVRTSLLGLAVIWSSVAGAQAPPPVAPPPVAPVAKTTPAFIQPAPRPQGGDAISVGKWPEGVVATGGAIWVAQSGDRTVGRVDPAKGTVKSVKIGRLPVSMAVGPDGAVIVQVNTNKVLKRIDPKTNKVKPIITLPDAPEEMVVDGGFAYVLLWQNDSSAGSSVLRVDLKTGKSTRSADTGKNAFDVAVSGGLVWVARTEGELVAIDATTLAPKATVTLGGRPFHVAASSTAVYSAVPGKTLVRVDSATQKETVRADLEGEIRALAAWDDVVVAGTADGSLWVLDPNTLATRVQLQPAKPYSPQTIGRDGQTLLVTHHGGPNGSAEKGTLLRIPLE